MPIQLPPGPYRRITLDDGTSIPFYMLPFDKDGICEGPETRRRLLEDVVQGVYTDIFVFSHGWNNDWPAAVNAYEGFIQGFMAMRRTHNLTIADPYRPLLVGIFWPSSALLFTEAERGPDIAAGEPTLMDHTVAVERQALREVAEHLPRRRRPRFYALMQQTELGADEALELAKLVKSLYTTPDDEIAAEDALAPATILDAWRLVAAKPEQAEDEDGFGTVGGSGGGPQVAGGLASFDPRNILRVLTVYQMKDRAGTVGALGVGPLLRDLLAAKDVKLHVIGHSFVAKVALSAIAAGGPFAQGRKVESLLLLQPAVSHLCLADQVPGTNRAGGYRNALQRVRKPILATFSAQDFPLHHLFHLALRRPGDLGEAQIAAGEHPEPPNRFAALGGYGPRLAGETLLPIQPVNSAYPLDNGVPVYGVNGSGVISSHNDFSRPETWWALYCLVANGRN